MEEAKKALAESVKQANEGFETSMDDTFADAGYAKSGGVYGRETIMRSTFFETVTENLRVGGYVWYAMPALQLKVDLSPGRLSGLEAGAVMDLVGAAQEEVGSAQKKIFGEGKELSQKEKKAKGLLMSVRAEKRDITKEMGEGEFGAYIGYAPEFTEEPDFDKSEGRNIIVRGKGELGRLMGDFIWNEMRESRGWTELAAPRWDKPLWDDTGSWFKAPSIRSVGTIVAGIVATVATGGIGGIAGIAATAAITTSSTVLFDTLDVAYGYKSWEEAGLDIGKSFLTSAATSTIGGVFNGFNVGEGFAKTGLTGTLGEFGKGAVGKALLAGAQTFTTNTATSAISAFSWSNGKLGWDKDTFTQGAFGKGAWASVAGAAGAAGTSTFLTGNLTGFGKLHAADVTSVANLAGGLASSGIQYGMTGETTLNVMNFADLGGSAKYGLMEMHLGGSRGFGMNMGSSGTDMSVGTIGRAMSGMGTFVKQQEFNWYEAFGGVQYAENYTGSREVGTQLRENYSFGDAAALAQQERLLSGQDKLKVGYISDPGLTTAAGNSRLVDLATLGQKGNIASQLAAGIVMGHEAYRNGTYDGAVMQEYETQRAVLGHTQMALRMAKEYGTGLITRSENLTKDVLNYLQGPEEFSKYVGATYDSSADYWKLAKDAKGKYGWEWDNSLDFDVSLLQKEGKLAKAVMENPELAAAVIFGGGKISNKNMNGMVANQLSYALMPYVAGRTNSGLEWISPQLAAYNDARKAFELGTVSFASASAAAQTLMANPTPGGVGALNEALMRVQSSGLLVKSSGSIDRSGLIGDGTDELPYLPVRADAKGKVSLTGYAEYRFVDDEFYGGLKRSLVDTGKYSQAWLDENYPLHSYARNQHSGGDVVGSGDVIASVSGNYALSYDAKYGFGSAVTSALMANTQYFNGHMAADSVMDYIATFSANGTTLAKNGDGYNLNGIIAGTVIGTQGSTGIADGAHVHSEIRTLFRNQWVVAPRLWNSTFGLNDAYSSALEPTTWALRNSGYPSPNLSDSKSWNSLNADWEQYGYDYMNMPRFFADNLRRAPSGFKMNWDDFAYALRSRGGVLW